MFRKVSGETSSCFDTGFLLHGTAEIRGIGGSAALRIPLSMVPWLFVVYLKYCCYEKIQRKHSLFIDIFF